MKITFWNAQKNADLNVRSLIVMSIPFVILEEKFQLN